jgi:DNA modification methylase
MNDLSIEYVPPGDLKPWARNARTHSRRQIRQIADSIRTFGFTNAILVDDTGRVVAGHGRLLAAQLLGLDRVPVVRLADMSEEKLRAYVIADNRLAEIAGWDRGLLALELGELANLETGFDLTITGFETAEIDLMIAGDAAKPDPADQPVEVQDGPAVTRAGDIWNLGRHRIACGDALQADTFDRLMDGGMARMAFCDPPYNVPIDGHVSGLGRIRHAEFAMACGEMSEEEFVAFLAAALRNVAEFSLAGSLHYVAMDWGHLFELLAAGRQVYTELKNICVWVKTNGGMGSFYRSQHEMVCVFKKGTAPHVNNIQLGRFGRYRTNVWPHAGANSFGGDRDRTLAMHPTVKPVALIADAILDCTNRGDLVLDAFGGSGSTLLAAERTGRRGRLVELDPKYVDVTIRRFRGMTGEDARHAETGLTFTEIAALRAAGETDNV